MESGNGFGEAARRVIAELQRDIDDIPVRCEDLQPGGGEPALVDVVAHHHTAQHGKALLNVKGGQRRLLCDFLDGQFLPEMLFDILDYLMKACYGNMIFQYIEAQMWCQLLLKCSRLHVPPNDSYNNHSV